MARMMQKNKKLNKSNDKSNKSPAKLNKSFDFKLNKSMEKTMKEYENTNKDKDKYENIIQILKENGNLKENEKTIKRNMLKNKMEYCKAMIAINRKNKEKCEHWLLFRKLNNKQNITHDGFNNMHEEIIRACLCNMKYFSKKYYKYSNLYYKDK